MKDKNKPLQQKNELKSTDIKWGGLINEFLWMCAGANRKVLRQCPTEYAKYAGIGGTILFTALMAMLSGGYALYTVFDSDTLAMGFGLLWGLLIFNLDRLIVNTMYTDGKVTISRRELLSGLPRIIMAIFLGIVISCPLELRIFEDEINIKIEEMKDRKLQQSISTLVSERDSIADLIKIEEAKTYEENKKSRSSVFDATYNRHNAEYERLVNEISGKESEISALLSKRSRLDTTATNYLERKRQLTAKIQSLRNDIAKLKPQKNQAWVQMVANNDELKNDIRVFEQQKETEIARLRGERDTLITQIASAKVHHMGWNDVRVRREGSVKDKIELEFGGFQTRMKAFSELRKENASTDITAWFIMLLFIIVEIAPTFLKMMIASGPYDDLLRAEMHRTKVLADKRISDVNDEINTAVMISTQINQERIQLELEANKTLMNKIASVQSELIETAIEEWRHEELDRIKENPSEYVSMNYETEK